MKQSLAPGKAAADAKGKAKAQGGEKAKASHENEHDSESEGESSRISYVVSHVLAAVIDTIAAANSLWRTSSSLSMMCQRSLHNPGSSGLAWT